MTEIATQPIPIMYVATISPEEASAAFKELEQKIGSLQGRSFYGVSWDDIYWAAVAMEEGDDADALELSTGFIPGGKYVQEKITDWEDKVDDIAPTVEEIMTEYDHDESRPTVEFYRSQKELRIWVPVL